MKVKICGLTTMKDAVSASNLGADLLGFVFVRNTPRYIGADNNFDTLISPNNKTVGNYYRKEYNYE